MLFRFRYQELGGHTHVRLFAGKHEAALGKCGDLVFRNEEWAVFHIALMQGRSKADGCKIEFEPERET